MITIQHTLAFHIHFIIITIDSLNYYSAYHFTIFEYSGGNAVNIYQKLIPYKLLFKKFQMRELFTSISFRLNFFCKFCYKLLLRINFFTVSFDKR